jgi:hypothetical protein
MLVESHVKLKGDKELLNEEYKNTIKQCSELQGEMKNWKAIAEANSALVQEQEEKIKRLVSEKRDFELLLTRYYVI